MIEIRHRETGDVLRRVDAETLRGVNLRGLHLPHADFSEHGDLRRVDLSGAILTEASFRAAALSRICLDGTDLREADLSGASARSASLRGAWLFEANLNGSMLARAHIEGATIDLAKLRRANLTAANLEGASLQCADLRGAVLVDACFRGACLREADLRGADLRSALPPSEALDNAILSGAIHDAHTCWPTGFDPQAHGAARETPIDYESFGEFWRVTYRLPPDYTPYGEEERWADRTRGYPDCSCGCRWWRPLWDPERAGRDLDWGVCANPASHRAGLLTFEHQGCFEFEMEERDQHEADRGGIPE